MRGRGEKSDFSSLSGRGHPLVSEGEYSGTGNDFGQRTEVAANAELP